MSRKTLASHPSEVRELKAPTTAAALLNFLQSLSTPRADRTVGHLFESPGWALEVTYECGLLLEPKLADRFGHTIEPGTVLIRAHRIEHAAAWEAQSEKPQGFGDAAEQSAAAASGRGLLSGGGAISLSTPTVVQTAAHASAHRGMQDPLGQATYSAAVARVIEYIRAGDIYQANLTHALASHLTGSPRDFFAELYAEARPWFGAYLESPDGGATCCVSPELFLAFDPASGILTTRPMKGTRPQGAGAEHSAELLASAKDRAELAMIIDLMRNDLGRVCELGTVRVDAARTLESHANGTLLQTTGTVSGQLNVEKAGGLPPIVAAIKATFPGGSITGAPKIRAMEIIHELEQGTLSGPRSIYCGSIGYLADTGGFALNIAIRTARLTPAHAPQDGLCNDYALRYGIGAGIVAESDPQAEWRETLDKASVLFRVAQRNPEQPRSRESR